MSHRAPRPSRGVYLRRRVVVFGAVPCLIGVLIYGLVASFSGGHTPPHVVAPVKHAPVASRSLEVGLAQLSVNDTTRPTYNYATGKTTAGRTLGLSVYYPTRFGKGGRIATNATVDREKHWPLVVFAPGYRLRVADYVALVRAWVQAGYVVVGIAFPDTTYPASEVAYDAGLPKHAIPEADLYNEPADVAFVVRSLERLDATRGSVVHGLFNARDVVLAGHSDGGSAMAALVYDSAYQVSGLSVRGVAVLSGAEFSLSNQHYGQSTPPTPLLAEQSATDQCNAPDAAVLLYDAIGAPKDFVELTNATHLGSYNGEDPAALGVVIATTLSFFAASVRLDHAASAQVLAVGTKNGVSQATDVASVAPIATPPGATSCPVG